LAFFALLGAFFAGVAFFPDLGLAGATFARRAPTLAFFFWLAPGVSAAWAVSVSSVVDVMIFLLGR
jgi:hypothetical protein